MTGWMCNDHGYTVRAAPCCDRAVYVSGPRPSREAPRAGDPPRSLLIVVVLVVLFGALVVFGAESLFSGAP